jgi:hypothetical protein
MKRATWLEATAASVGTARSIVREVYDLGTFDSTLEPASLDSTSGRGMQIIAAVADRLEVRNGNGRTLVRFEKHRSSSATGASAHPPTNGHTPEVEPSPVLAADAGGGA